MRPQQQNRRMRGRNNNGGGGNNNNNNNNNRRGPNPLTRNYESNGPDVKIRGSAQQIAEKYAQLARDAQGGGDRVMAENYLQHAEHYNRIIAAAQAQMPIQNMQNNRDLSDDDMDDEREEFENQPATGGNAQVNGNVAHAEPSPQPVVNAAAEPQPVNPSAAPQPVIEGVPAEVALNPEAAGDSAAPEAVEQGSEAAAPRRARRPRRTTARARAGDDAPQDGGLAATLSRGASADPAAAGPSGKDSDLAPVEN